MFSRKVLFFLIFLFLIGLGLRLYRLDEGLIFGYDQARDAYRATEIISKSKLKLLGPETDIPGVHHGVGYYYLLSLPYSLFKDPVISATFLAFLNTLGIFIIYFAAYKFFLNRRLALIAGILFTFSFEIVQYSRWLSNPSLGVISVMFAFIGMWYWIKGKEYGFLLALFSIVLSLHFQLFLTYLFLVPILVYFIYKPKLRIKIFLWGFLIAVLVTSPIIISEFKFNFQTLKSFWNFFQAKGGSYSSLIDFLDRYFNRFSSVSFHTIIPLGKTLVYILVVLAGIILIRYKDKISRKSAFSLILIWLFSSLPIFFFASGAINSEFSFIGTAVSLLFLTAYFINILWRKHPYIAKLLLLIIIITNVRYNLINADNGAYIFSVQNVMTYGLEKKLIDYTYQEAKGNPFSICTLTNPLFINTTWSYLYENYGKNSYGYLPYFAGSDQTGYLSYLPKDKVKPALRYLIYEPLIGIPKTSIELFYNLEELISDMEEEKYFGDFKVEKRRHLTEKEKMEKKAKYPAGFTQELENDAYLPYRCFN